MYNQALTLKETFSTARAQENVTYFQVIEHNHAMRTEVEHFICNHYWFQFSACLQSLPRRLLVVMNEQQEILAACGVQFASEQQLFSERYIAFNSHKSLTDHVRVMGEQYHSPRMTLNAVMEVGSLAVSHPKHVKKLISAVLEYANRHQVEWFVFTLTQLLQKYFNKLGLKTTPIANADVRCVPESEVGSWGRYYEHNPQVLLGWIGHQHLFTGFTPVIEHQQECVS